MAMVQVNLRLPPELLLRVDGARGDVSRNLWVRRAVERALEESGAPGGAVVSTSSPAPAEQPDTRAMDLLREDDPDPDFIARGPKFGTFPKQPVRRVSPSRPASPQVPFRRDVKPFQRGES